MSAFFGAIVGVIFVAIAVLLLIVIACYMYRENKEETKNQNDGVYRTNTYCQSRYDSYMQMAINELRRRNKDLEERLSRVNKELDEYKERVSKLEKADEKIDDLLNRYDHFTTDQDIISGKLDVLDDSEYNILQELNVIRERLSKLEKSEETTTNKKKSKESKNE